jgi:hypothetical protein
MSLRKYLPVLLLLVAVLQAPLNSFAHNLTSGAALNSCSCELLTTACCADEKSELPDHFPGNGNGDCCDCDECCPDASEPPISCTLRVTFSAKQHFHQYADGHVPEVYLAIFVPPQSCSSM